MAAILKNRESGELVIGYSYGELCDAAKDAVVAWLNEKLPEDFLTNEMEYIIEPRMLHYDYKFDKLMYYNMDDMCCQEFNYEQILVAAARMVECIKKPNEVSEGKSTILYNAMANTMDTLTWRHIDAIAGMYSPSQNYDWNMRDFLDRLLIATKKVIREQFSVSRENDNDDYIANRTDVDESFFTMKGEFIDTLDEENWIIIKQE